MNQPNYMSIADSSIYEKSRREFLVNKYRTDKLEVRGIKNPFADFKSIAELEKENSEREKLGRKEFKQSSANGKAVNLSLSIKL